MRSDCLWNTSGRSMNTEFPKPLKVRFGTVGYIIPGNFLGSLQLLFAVAVYDRWKHQMDPVTSHPQTLSSQARLG
ncbi:hypothetical protein RvY_16444-2 [Ramazzottius varieornatus]|uniref:Uncharacterized protein n=1 Tax=Ramazzottius varieornatus TaxID=947166 RepID=A0A1D1VYI0_RAMVA|nr:hypothetical protein RvY_16444-2 [Ramazzottius varieornatus]